MNEQHIARLEAQLEQLVESAFAQLFGKRIRGQDVALQLARAMEDQSRPARGSDLRPFAPDVYSIYLHGDVYTHLMHTQPMLAESLATHLVELAQQAGYRLNHHPQLVFLADNRLDRGALLVSAAHSDQPANRTEAMQPVQLVRTQSAPRNAQLVINGARTVPLTQNVVNVGRERDNTIVLDDNFASRYHAQLRLRDGMYLLFDVNSKSGTYVNNVLVREHRLQAGDVIRIGKTQLVYLYDDPLADSQVAPLIVPSTEPE